VRRLATIATLAVVVAFGAGTATAAPRVLVAPVYGEPDVADEAAAVGLLLRASLDGGEPGAVVALPPNTQRPRLERAAAILAAADAELLVLAHVDRLGPTLVAAAQVIDRTGVVIGNTAAQADDGAVAELAAELAKDLAGPLALSPLPVPELSLGQLRPFARAEQLAVAGQKDAAARALAGADPVIALRVSSARLVAQALWTDAAVDGAARLIACSVGGSASDVITLSGTDASPAARTARALAQVGLSDVAAAERELKGMKPGPDTALARAAIAQLRQNKDARDAAIGELLAPGAGVDKQALAWLAKLPPNALPPSAETALVHAGAQAGDRRIAAVIGVRAAEAGIALDTALTLISVVELDRAERARLAQVLPKATGADAWRLAAELALAEGDLVGAQAALAKLRRATDPRAALFRGRIAWALGDLSAAADELGLAEAGLERARVLMAKGDVQAANVAAGSNARSRVAQVAAAEVAALDGRRGDAVKQLRLAEDLAPGDRDTQLRLATALELAGDHAGAERARAWGSAMAEVATPPSKPTTTLTGTASGVAAGSGSGSAAPLKPTAGSKAYARLREQLAPLLAAFPPGSLTSRNRVIAPIGEAPSAWGFRVVDPQPLVSALGAALEDLPYQARVLGVSPHRFADRPAVADLMAVASGAGANGIVLYAVDTDGALRLVAFDTDSQTALEQRGSIDTTDLVAWNPRWLAIPIAILGGLAAFVLFIVVRGSGVIEVKIDKDPAGTNEVFCVEVQKTSRRWVIRDLEAFRQATVKAGAKVGRRTARLVGGTTRFKVPPGHWYVHLYGIYDQRGGGTRLIDDQHSTSVDLGRNAVETVRMDLTPRTIELRVRIYDENPRGGFLWVDDSTHKTYTDLRGAAVLHAPLGSRTLHGELRGFKFHRDFDGSTPGVEDIEIDIERERRGEALPARPKPRDSISFDGGAAGSGERPPSGERRPVREPSGERVPAAAAAVGSERDRERAKDPNSLSFDRSLSSSSERIKVDRAIGGPSTPQAPSQPSLPALVIPAGALTGPIEIPDEPQFDLDAAQTSPAAQLAARAGTLGDDETNPVAAARAAAAVAAGGGGGAPAAKLAAAAATPGRGLAHGSLVPPAATAFMPTRDITPLLGATGTAGAVPDVLLGRYRITETLGRGAMGVVYRARDQHLEREVAIKVLASELRHHPDALRLFVEEAKALASLNHPNIVSVFDQSTDGNDAYLIMEYVDGRTLEGLLEERRKLAVRTALALVDQLCAGLAYAHARRVIHRDIKPANIFVSRERIVKLGDFGLARVMREISIRRTEIRGTPLYMAPEQITGENVTHRSDLYAVGCTLFELVTGRPPFADGEIMYHHLHTPPPRPSDLEPQLTDEFDALVLSCIAKDSAERIESANAIRDRIRALMTRV
jgi:hypothetical protein